MSQAKSAVRRRRSRDSAEDVPTSRRVTGRREDPDWSSRELTGRTERYCDALRVGREHRGQ